MIAVIATITLREHSRDAFLQRMKQLVPLVLEEEGCIEYGPYIDIDAPAGKFDQDANSVIMIERWESEAHLQAHSVAAHMQAYRQDVACWVVSVSLRVLEQA
ncbi:antibiotic biosynthesis monooxygenase [Pokkaliibacter plantistimulans]|uniref:Antibiotic biosynthesis monooxygenase n=1 Tax=Proteobacteria bacterium 228 TaxID=2083153 RepID=A0A2S5KV62_9PROT|nr:putative quinol monooxygenase [Pokkaliibacter plantistimulans]PPC78613.1 antibiotic biosynthesis monooxygenase [Pokkaliibacter plantistimulans]